MSNEVDSEKKMIVSYHTYIALYQRQDSMAGKVWDQVPPTPGLGPKA